MGSLAGGLVTAKGLAPPLDARIALALPARRRGRLLAIGRPIGPNPRDIIELVRRGFATTRATQALIEETVTFARAQLDDAERQGDAALRDHAVESLGRSFRLLGESAEADLAMMEIVAELVGP